MKGKRGGKENPMLCLVNSSKAPMLTSDITISSSQSASVRRARFRNTNEAAQSGSADDFFATVAFSSRRIASLAIA